MWRLLKDGGYSRPLMERLKAQEAEVEEIEQRLAEAPREVPDIPPNVAELYRRKVEALAEALDRPEDRDEGGQRRKAAGAFRSKACR